MLFLTLGSTARVGAQSTAISFPSSLYFFHPSLTYTDSCDKKSQRSLLNHNFCGASSLGAAEKQLPRTKLHSGGFPHRDPLLGRCSMGEQRGQMQAPPQHSPSPRIHVNVSESQGELKQNGN